MTRSKVRRLAFAYMVMQLRAGFDTPGMRRAGRVAAEAIAFLILIGLLVVLFAAAQACGGRC